MLSNPQIQLSAGTWQVLINVKVNSTKFTINLFVYKQKYLKADVIPLSY